MSGQGRGVGAPGNPSLLREFPGLTGLDKACVSDINVRRRGMKGEHGAIHGDLFIHVTYFFPWLY